MSTNEFDEPGRSQYPLLFQPLPLGPITLKNRIVNAPHQTGFAARGHFTPKLLAYHEERARGGAGLLVTQAATVVPDYSDMFNIDDSVISEYRAAVERVRPHGAHFAVELTHPGRQSFYTGDGVPVYYAPSAVPLSAYGVLWRVPHEIEPAMIEDIIERFGAAGARCRAGGVSGVELHFAHGNLVEQFLSPRTNHRRDEWGGSFENRLRFANRVLTSVRAAIGDGMSLGCRITGLGLDEGDLGEFDSLEVAGTVASWGLLDYMSVTMGGYYDALNTARNMPGMMSSPGLWRRYAKQMRSVVDIPTFLVGRINHPQTAEELLAEGACDAVVMARALIADPFLPEKALRGRTDDIRPCVGAMECYGSLKRIGQIRCVHNPRVGREGRWPEEPGPARDRRRAAVVGAGPAGLEAARILAARRHDVILLEREHSVGGQVRFAAKAPGRGELHQVIEWLHQRCVQTGVDIRLGVDVTPETILDLRPDLTVVATGSRPRRLQIDGVGGADQIPVIDGVDVLRGGVRIPGSRVVLWDEFGDWHGFSIAHAVAAQGVTVHFVTPVMYPGMALDVPSWRLTYEALSKLGVVFHPSSQIVHVKERTVDILEGYAAQHPVHDIDAVVSVCAGEADDSLYRDLKALNIDVRLIGDAVAPRNIEAAIYDGTNMARSYDE